MFCSLETESLCFHSLPFGFQDKIMVLPRVSSLTSAVFLQHRCTQQTTFQPKTSRSKTHIFADARKRRQRNFQTRGSALWRCRILGLCPVICLYCNSNTTIPEWVANSAEGAFPVGRKSTKTEPGSATYVINNLGLKFSR